MLVSDQFILSDSRYFSYYSTNRAFITPLYYVIVAVSLRPDGIFLNRLRSINWNLGLKHITLKLNFQFINLHFVSHCDPSLIFFSQDDMSRDDISWDEIKYWILNIKYSRTIILIMLKMWLSYNGLKPNNVQGRHVPGWNVPGWNVPGWNAYGAISQWTIEWISINAL